jgi:TolB-like protein/DNA-binding winged helix-turn-helix (wHTH) protein
MNINRTAPPTAVTEVFLVGDLRVDIGQQRVTRAGRDIVLPNLSYQLLLALIRAAPNVLSNESLMTQVWPGLIVSPETVNKRVNLLRDALGDDAREPRYIAGLRSRGYRLMQAVVRATEDAVPPDLALPSAESATQPADFAKQVASVESHREGARKRRKWRWVARAVLAVVVVAGAMVWMGYRDHAGAPSRPLDQPRAGGAPIGVRERTVAVLPFDSISPDSADAYLAQGLPEMILNRLSRISGLSVIARNSSFALATRTIDSREIGRRLNSGYLISGSVQREADRLRVAVQLVDSAAGTQVWSAHFDRALRDIFDVEDEIADQVAEELATTVGGLESKPLAG